MKFIKGKFPQKSGNYIVRYKDKIGRDDFTTLTTRKTWFVGVHKKHVVGVWKKILNG